MVCSPSSATLMCQSRRDAMRSGEMVYRAVTRRWYFPLNYLFSVWPQGWTRFAWTFCPFCGGSLPDTDQPPAVGGCNGEWNGEDGG